MPLSGITIPTGVVGLALLWSACAPQRGTDHAAVAGIPQPRDTTSPQARPAEAWTPALPLTGRAIKCENGRIQTFACRNVELLSYLPKGVIGESSGYDLWGWHDSVTKREFLLIGGKATAFIEVTDPVNPMYLGVLPPHEGVTRHSAQSVKVYQHYAFIGYEGADNGLQIFDLTQLRNVKRPPVVFQETAHYDQFGNAHTIALNPETGFAYINGSTNGKEPCGGGLHMIDVRTPTKPVFAGCYTNPAEGGIGGSGYVHDTQCTRYRGPDRQYRGREICLNSSGSGVVIVDVTDKTHPKMISIARYPNVGFAHQGWLTADQRYFFLDDEYDEGAMPEGQRRTRTIAFDLKDLDDPVVLTEFFNTTTDTDHNLYIRGHYMYQGNYGAGLRIIDIADPKSPKEVGYLSRQGTDTEGPWAWAPYPYFKNDVVAVSMSTGVVLARLLKKSDEVRASSSSSTSSRKSASAVR